MPGTGFLLDQRYLEHDTGPMHPERADRLRAIRQELDRRGLLEQLEPVSAEAIDTDDPALLAVHEAEYVERVARACQDGRALMDDDPDCPICPASFEIARLAAGGVLQAVEAVVTGRLRNAFCAVRPPGHHAERNRAMGFCLFNNVAVAARRALQRFGLSRVAIVDWDVHHGNGTQQAFEEDDSVLYVSLHEDPRYLYPGTGYAEETGRGPGAGYTVNLPMMPGAGDEQYRSAFEQKVLPAVRQFQPDLVLLSAGFDAHADDPLAHIALGDAGFAWMLQQMLSAAAECCEGRLISVLEGGYDLAVLSRCVADHIELLLV